jgi:hypothetical protein
MVVKTAANMAGLARIPHQNKAVGFCQRPRPLHNPYTRTGTCFHWGVDVAYNRYKLLTVLLPKRPRIITAVSILKPPSGGFRSETATWTPKWVKKTRWGLYKVLRVRPVYTWARNWSQNKGGRLTVERPLRNWLYVERRGPVTSYEPGGCI